MVINRMKGFLAALTLILLAAPAWPATYYVDCAADPGGDGTTQATSGEHAAWDLVADVNGGSFSPGDSILFKKGCTWREQLEPPSSGSSENPITLGNYGSGALPIINGADVISSWTAAATEETGGVFATGLEDEVDAFTTDFDGKTTAGSNTMLVTTTAGEFNNGAKGAESYYNGTSPVCYTHKAIGGQTDFYVRAYIKLDAAFAFAADYNRVSLFTVIDDTASARVFAVTARRVDAATYALNAFFQHSGGNVEDLVNITLGTWYCVEVHYKCHATEGGFQWWVDEVSQGSNFALNTSASTGDTLRVGGGGSAWPADNPNAGSYVYYDDVKVDTSYIGPTALLPAGSYSKSGITTEPLAVWFDGTLGEVQESIAACISNNDWYWASDVLYINSSSNPSGRTIEAGQRGYCVTIWQKNYITVDGLHATKNNSTWTGGIMAWGHSPSGTDIIVKNCTVSHTRGGVSCYSVDNFTAQDNEIYGDPAYSIAGLSVNIDASKSCLNYTATGNTIHDARLGMNLPIGTAAEIIDGGLITKNTIYDVEKDALAINYVAGLVIEYNLVYNGGTVGGDTTGIHIATAPGTIIRYNLAHGWGDPTHVGGNGIQIDTDSDGSVAYGNVCYGNDGAGISVVDSASVLLYNNTCYGNNVGSNQGEIRLAGPVQDSTTATVKNNIGLASGSNYAVYIDAATSNNTLSFDSNCWKNSSGNWYYDGTEGGNSLTTWNAKSYVGTDLNSDPLMTDPGNGDFTLQAGSPCIDAGVNLGASYLEQLLAGSTWPAAVETMDWHKTGGAPDAGAYGYRKLIW